MKTFNSGNTLGAHPFPPNITLLNLKFSPNRHVTTIATLAHVIIITSFKSPKTKKFSEGGNLIIKCVSSKTFNSGNDFEHQLEKTCNPAYVVISVLKSFTRVAIVL